MLIDVIWGGRKRFKEAVDSICLDISAMYSLRGINAYWSRCARNRNFGDQLTPFIIKSIEGENPNYVLSKSSLLDHYVFSGSVLASATRRSTVWGAGIMKPGHLPLEQPHILAVRGPLSCNALIEAGYICPEIFGDPGEVIDLICDPETDRQHRIGVIPHYDELVIVKSILPKKVKKEIVVIDLTDDIDKVVTEIKSCECTVSSSLHGLIVSHTYGVKSVWCKFLDTQGRGPVDRKGDFKFQDYLANYSIYKSSPIPISAARINDEVGLIESIAYLPKKDISRLMSFINACPFNLRQYVDKSDSYVCK